MTQKISKHLSMEGPGQFTLHGDLPEDTIDAHVHLGVYATINLLIGQLNLTGPGTFLENLREHVQDILLYRSQLLSDFPRNILSMIKGIFNVAPLKTDLVGPGPKPVYLLTDFPAFFQYNQPAFMGLNSRSLFTIIPQIVSMLKAFPNGLEQANRCNLLDYLETYKIKQGVVLPIAVSRFDIFTQATFETCLGYEQLPVFCSIHPDHPDIAGQFDHFKKMGAQGFKFHPDFQHTPPDSEKAHILFEHCRANNLVVQCHVGWPVKEIGLSRASAYEAPIKHFSDLRFILSHMGMAEFEETLNLAKTYDNVILETSGQTSDKIKKAGETIGSERIIFGTDWPMYHPAVPISCVLDAFSSTQDLERVLGQNIKQILDENNPQD
ncbi:MAG: hypothetical protein OMM_00852 [Candidatus Magnetoglobus multicellularis str. Araruama]|uniref:Amidohydrolase-related domain-containing protein n=1 Tax=Candidatus Magnetoglobus multicellularis str. Araruama TaxID=890399 RepID=A0A1V1PFL5_9BACT|nr:MAG: hypothetical protein OMM_00852 [Candidatus Magnetoglobus multicellularis str. Araruama]